jgi:hypothetical protein
MVLYIYKYWFKMLKRWKFPPLIKARASSANCTMCNLTCSHHATYLHTIYVKSREIHILSTIQILDFYQHLLHFLVQGGKSLLGSIPIFFHFSDIYYIFQWGMGCIFLFSCQHLQHFPVGGGFTFLLFTLNFSNIFHGIFDIFCQCLYQ